MTVPVTELGDWPGLRRQFDHAHERAYGYAAADVDVQLLNLRLTLIRPLEPPRLPVLDRRRAGAPAFETRKIHSMTAGDALEYRVYQRASLSPGDEVAGPAAIEESGTTTIIDAGDTLSVDDHGCLIIDLQPSEAMGGVGGSKHCSP